MGFVPTRNAERAREFYEKTLGLTFVSADPFATVFQTGDSLIRVVNVPEFTPHPFTVLGWEVDDIEPAVKSLKESGTTFQRYPWVPASDGEIWTAPDGSRVAWFVDPDGNTLSLSQHRR